MKRSYAQTTNSSSKNAQNQEIHINNAEEKIQIRYLDLIRAIDLNDFKRFKQLAAKVNLNELQQGNKPFLFHAIAKNDLELVNYLLEEEIDLNTVYQIDLDLEANEKTKTDSSSVTTEKGSSVFNLKPVDYAWELHRDAIHRLIRAKMDLPSLHERWMKVVESLDVNKIEHFRRNFKNFENAEEFLELGLIKASELGSNNLIDYFLNLDVDVNCVAIVNGIRVTPLIQAISFNKKEAAKYLIFRKADINQEGEYGNSLVTAVHYESPNDLITTILEKGASLASRHKQWPTLNLREYCVQFNKVQAKSAIDSFVFHLIACGDYKKLRDLYENGYISINVTNRFRKTGRDLAIERCHFNIVQLIDKIEERQRRIKTKMNY